MTPREAAITLNLIPGLGPVRVMRLMQVFASPELVLEAPASMLMDIPGIGAQLARHISSWRSIGSWNWRIRRGPRSPRSLTPPIPPPCAS